MRPNSVKEMIFLNTSYEIEVSEMLLQFVIGEKEKEIS